jgi:hypothetical protein
MKRILVLFEPGHFDGLPKELFRELNMDIVVYPFKFGFRNPFFNFLKLIKKNNAEIFILDYRPLGIQLLLSFLKINNVKTYLIQHGHFEKNIERNFKQRQLSWYLNSFYISFLYLFYSHNEFNVFKRFKLVLMYLKFGSEKIIPLISKNKYIDKVFLLNNDSLSTFKIDFKGSYSQINVVGKLDFDSFVFAKHGCTIYVTQPFHLTGHSSKINYTNYLKGLFFRDPEILFLKHPKIESAFFYHINSEIKVISKDSLKINHCQKVIGHFSSILFGIDSNIELILDEYINDTLLKEVLIFNPYETGVNGLNNIKQIIND